MPDQCPVRKLDPDGALRGPDLELVSGPGERPRWVVRSFALARQVLREQDGTRQAGFGGDRARGSGGMRPPILYLEGQPHRSQRKATARFFAPKVIEGYRPMIESLSDELVARLRRDRAVDLSELALTMAMQVVARVVGLTNSSLTGMSRRLNTFFERDPLAPPERGLAGRLRLLQAGTATARFYQLDVKPAIRARRRRPQEDVISQLLSEGFSDLEILTECLTYGAAGMVTTREFVTMAGWHLLDDPALLARFRDAEQPERSSILEETLRLEPVVGHLYRQTERELELAGTTVPQSALVDLDLRAVNADAATVGEQPYGLCPARPLPATVPPVLMSFGDGHHRCPGGPLALLESEIFLSTLFRHDVVAEGPPQVHWNPVSQGYDLRGLLLRLR